VTPSTPRAGVAEFVAEWLRCWNDHDVEGVLAHFSDEVVFTSPVAARALDGSDGVVRGKDALRAYWSYGLSQVPDLRFELVATYLGVTTVVINYRNQRGQLVNEVLTFEGGLVVEGHATYLEERADPAANRGVEQQIAPS
jgi:hypothetical protein